MKAPIVVVPLALLALAACSRSPLVGTWVSDHDLTAESIRRDSDPEHKLDEAAVERLVGPTATVTFTASEAVFDLPPGSLPTDNPAAVHETYAYSVGALDAQHEDITLAGPAPGASRPLHVHFEGRDLLWIDNEVGNTDLPIHSFRQYFRRAH